MKAPNEAACVTKLGCFFEPVSRATLDEAEHAPDTLVFDPELALSCPKEGRRTYVAISQMTRHGFDIVMKRGIEDWMQSLQHRVSASRIGNSKGFVDPAAGERLHAPRESVALQHTSYQLKGWLCARRGRGALHAPSMSESARHVTSPFCPRLHRRSDWRTKPAPDLPKSLAFPNPPRHSAGRSQVWTVADRYPRDARVSPSRAHARDAAQ